MGDAVGDRRGLARARAGDDRDRSPHGLGGAPLLVVQSFEDGGARRGHGLRRYQDAPTRPVGWAAVGVVHTVVGYAVVAVFTVGWAWGAWALLRKRPPGDRFWGWLTVAQVVAGVQALLGIGLFLMGRRPSALLHYVYGLGPLAVLVVAHVVARESQRARPGSRQLQAWVPFSLGSFICFGLSLRALMTGLDLG